MFHDMDNSDTDSDSSGSSISLASTHSSDEEEEDVGEHQASYFNMDWKQANGKHPNLPCNGKLQVHSTPKGIFITVIMKS